MSTLRLNDFFVININAIYLDEIELKWKIMQNLLSLHLFNVHDITKKMWFDVFV